MTVLRRPLPRPARPHGSVAVPFAVTLPLVLGMMGLAIDLSMLYLRNTHMQHVADATAMAAARRLNGTLAGIAAAKQEATAIAYSNYYDGIFRTASDGQSRFVNGDSWSTGALFLSTAASGAEWVPADSVSDAATAATMLYAKVDTSVLNGLSANPGRVNTSFLRLLGAPDSVTTSPVSIAGPLGMQVTPLGVCALKTVKYTPHTLTPASSTFELEEFGYRRGVSYDLLHLNPSGSTPLNFLVNPIDGPDVLNPDPQHYTHDFIKPFFCSGTIAYANLRRDRTVHVAPLAGVDIHQWLNSRFNDYSGDACTPNGAPPDKNVTEYLPGTLSWMATTSPAAKTYLAGSALETIADPETVPANVATGDYGPLWIYKRPLKFVSATTGGGSSPTEFSRTEWSKLYYASSGSQFPYATQLTAAYNTNPSTSNTAFASRRLLNLPLLNCSGTITSEATVLGVGAFLMTSKATPASATTDASVYAEFEGLVDEAALSANVRRVR